MGKRGPKPSNKPKRIPTSISLPKEKTKKLDKLCKVAKVSRSVWVERKIDEEEK
jgi:predicted transcriptional regulator